MWKSSFCTIQTAQETITWVHSVPWLVQSSICWAHPKASCRATISHFPSSLAHWHQLHLDTNTCRKPSGNKFWDKFVALNSTFSLLLPKNLCLVQDICRWYNLNTEDSNKNRIKNPEEKKKKNQKWSYITLPQHFMQEYSVFSLPLPHPSRETHSCLVNFDMGLTQRFHPDIIQVVLKYVGLPASVQEYLYWRELRFQILEMDPSTEISPLCPEKSIFCCVS